jgi:iron complex outermembrane receptor protein
MDTTSRTAATPAIAHIGNAADKPNLPAGETADLGTQFCANCFSVPQGQNGVGVTWASILANPGVKNLRNPWADANVRPATDWNQATVVLDQRLTNDFFGLGPVSAFADAFWSNQRGNQLYPTGNGQARTALAKNLVIPTFNPYYPVGAPNNVRVDYNLWYEIPTKIVGGEVANHWDAGLNFDGLPFGWTGKYTFSITDDKNYGDAPNSVNANNLKAAVGQTLIDPNTQAVLKKPNSVPYLNVFCDATVFTCNDPATLAWVTGYRLQHERWWIQEQNLNFNGPIYDLPGGPLQFAIAGQTLSEHWTYQQVANYNTFSTADIQNGTDAASQRSYAIFGQADIPVFGQDFTLPFVQQFVLSLGYRYDHYNNLDDPVWTPKVAFNWLVGNGFSFRGAWGKSFRVPSFAENSPGGSRVAGLNPLGGAVNATDTAIFGCNSVAGSPSGVAIPGSATAVLNPTCSSNPALRQPGGISVELSGNGAARVLRGHGLGPQSLYQWSTGFHWGPTDPIFGVDLSGLNVDVSWFHLYFRGLIDNNSFGDDNPDNPLSLVEFTFIPNPNLPITDPANASFYKLVQDLAAVPNRGGFAFDTAFINNIKFIQDTALTNVGKRDFGGIDFDFRYDFDLSKAGFANIGALNIGAAGYYEITDKSRASELDPYDFVYQDRDSGNHLKRVRYRLGWSNDNWNTTIFANYFGHGAGPNNGDPGQNTAGANLVPPCFYLPTSGPGGCFPGSAYFGPASYYQNMAPAVVFWDLSIGYQTGEAPANQYLRNIGIQFTINNILNKEPPFQVGARGNGSIRAFDNNFSDLQRSFTLTLTKVW